MIESSPSTTLENSSNNKQTLTLSNPGHKVQSAGQGEQQEETVEGKTLVGNGEVRETVLLTGNPQMANSGLVFLSCIQPDASFQSSQFLKVFMVDQANSNQNVKFYRKIEPKPGSRAEGDSGKTVQESPQVCETTFIPVKKAKVVPKAKFVESNPTRRGVKSCPRCQQLIGYRAKQCKFCFPRTIKRRQIRDNIVKMSEETHKAPEDTPEKAATVESIEEEVPFVPSMVAKFAGDLYHQVVDLEHTKSVDIVNVTSVPPPSSSIAAETVSDVTSAREISHDQESQGGSETKDAVSSPSPATNAASFVNVVAVIENHEEEKSSANSANKNVVYDEVTLHDIVVSLLKNENQVKHDEPLGEMTVSNQTKEVEVKTEAEIEDDSKPMHVVNLATESSSEDKTQEPEKAGVVPIASSSTSPVVMAPILYQPTIVLVPQGPKGKDPQGSLFRRIQPKSGDMEGEGEDDGDEDEGMMDSSQEMVDEEESALGDDKKNKKLRRRSSSKGDNSRLLETNATRRGLMQCTKCFKKIGCRSKICKFCKGSLFDNPNAGTLHSPPIIDVPFLLKGQNVIKLVLPLDRPNTVFSIRKYKSGPDNRCFVKCIKKSKEDSAVYICDYAACSSSTENTGSLGGFSCEHVKLCLKNKTEQAAVVSLEPEGLRNFPDSMQNELQTVFKESVAVGIPLVQWVSERTFAVLDTSSNGTDGLDNFVHVRFQKSRPLVFCSGKFCLMNTVQKGGSYCVHYHACLWGIASDYRLRALLPVCRLTV